MSNVITPVVDPKTGKVVTNVQMCRIVRDKLLKIKNGVNCKSQKQKEQSEDRFFAICNGSENAEQVMKWLDQICDEPDEDKAQKLIERTLLPVNLPKIVAKK